MRNPKTWIQRKDARWGV